MELRQQPLTHNPTLFVYTDGSKVQSSARLGAAVATLSLSPWQLTPMSVSSPTVPVPLESSKTN
eukprot:scaffold79219_cov30-Prasinocladus_malaysianus.AAC.2